MKKIKLVSIFAGIVTAVCVLISTPASGAKQSFKDALSSIAAEFSGAISKAEIKRVGVSEFIPTSGETLKLGPYLSEKLTGALASDTGISVVERAKLDVLIEEMRLNQTGLVDESSAQEVGKILGAQAFVTGSYTIMGKKVEINTRLVATETGKVLAAASSSIKVDANLKSLLKPLVPDIPLYLEAAVLAQRKTDTGWVAVMVEEGGTLYSNDNIKIHFRANEDCYVYVLMFDSSGKASQIFPHPDISMSNRIEGERDYRIPPGGDWFWLDDNTGTETVYVIASYEQLTDITKMLMKMERVGAEGQAEASKKLEQKILDRGIGGVRPGENITFTTTDGKTVGKVTKVVEGKVSAVRKISFQHK